MSETNKNMKILIFSNIPAPYFVEYLNELGKYADVTAVFEKESFAHRDNSWKEYNVQNFKIEFLKGINIGKIYRFAPSVIKYLKKNENTIYIFTNPLTMVGMLGIEYCKIMRIPYVLQSEGGIPKDGKGIKEKIKAHFLQGAALYLSGMDKENDYFIAYGADPNKVHQYHFASLHEKNIIKKAPSLEEKQAIRKDLNINAKNVILFVGQIINRKGIDVLIRASVNLPDDTCIYIVGGEEKEPYKTLAEELHVNNVKYITFLSSDELRKYYLAADVFVLPTRYDTWGLAVNEAMSYGLPVITTVNCVAGMKLIKNEINGYLIESENYNQLHDCIVYLISTPKKRREMSEYNIQCMKKYTYENMSLEIYKTLNSYNTSNSFESRNSGDEKIDK